MAVNVIVQYFTVVVWFDGVVIVYYYYPLKYVLFSTLSLNIILHFLLPVTRHGVLFARAVVKLPAQAECENLPA